MNANKKVVIVDDSKVARGIIKEKLLVLGYEVIGEAVDGVQGFSMCAELQPNIVVSDIEMPKKDGIELTKKIKEEFPDMKVVVVSSVLNKIVVQKVKIAGASGIMKKPIDDSDFSRMMRGVQRGIK